MSKTVDQSNDGTTDQSIAYAYNGDNQLQTETATSPDSNADFPAYTTGYSYDNNGSTISAVRTGSGAGTNSYGYDVRNRMIASTVGGTAAADVYDDDGNMVSQTIGTTTTTFLLDKNNPTGYSQTLEAWTGGSTPTITYTIGKTVIGQNAGGTLTFIMVDGQGSTRQLTAYTSGSTNGQVKARFDYDAFGNSITFYNSVHAPNSADTSVRYQNEPVDVATLNPVMEVREDQTSIGRFLTMDDPSLIAAGNLANSNLYVFVGSNPLNLNDRSGNDGTGNDLADGAFGLEALAGAENLAGYISVSTYEQQHFAQIGAYTAASFALGDLMQNTLALDQQAAFAVTGAVGAAAGGLIGGFVSDLASDGVNALIYADEGAGSATSEVLQIGASEEAFSGEVSSDSALFSNGYKGRGLSQEEVDQITADFRAGGGEVDQGPDAQAYLQSRGAGGATLNESTILLPSDPTRTAVFEELIHAQQFAKGAAFGSRGTLEIEAEAAETLIRNRKLFQLDNDEVRQVVNNLRNIRAALGL